MDVRNIGVAETVSRIKKEMSRFEYIYVTIDIDSLDPAYAPGTGTPQFGGLHSRELLDLLYGLFELPVIGFDVVEVSPSLDHTSVAVFAARLGRLVLVGKAGPADSRLNSLSDR